ncbi:phosphate ABC transporter permease PstA [Sedimentisphaera salicampi]|uniref:Phosphate transport system permease protein PstA n=1 Tax=Sedimentisphaera salicampi TaxID=1941349 RepID=A0A1W6LLC7_9BACT|nr:phosphate ABC transporter permease PstA [Sedimentisphaera salicampi]ARN56556.1 Phosphate transport system permease protein PstA [Sedimentisphaera salicampi]
MREKLRHIKDKLFTFSAHFSIVLLVAALIIVLGPMLAKGFTAVVFQGTSEFRRLQLEEHSRGSKEDVLAEVEQGRKERQNLHDMIEDFNVGIDTSEMYDKARDIYREYSRNLRSMDLPYDEYSGKRRKAREVRDYLLDAIESEDEEKVNSFLEKVFAEQTNKDFKDTEFQKIFTLAEQFRETSKKIDFSKRDKYKEDLVRIKELMKELFGPAPGEEKPALIMEQYGATRWDMAQRVINEIMHKTEWVEQEGTAALAKKKVERRKTFKGTGFEAFFDILPQKAREILKPRTTFYWQYFIDDSTPGHYFGGVGPEIIGTLMLTLLAMAMAIPLGITAAAYLVECAGENMIVKIIRGFINTLAGVPSIVFGLFGMAFFVMFLLPAFGKQPQACVLTASMTLAVLVLPVIIRSSEEAIRAVPRTYKEASLALGAGNFSTFIFVTMPAAMPGILTGIILSLSRAAGETAPILFTGAVALGPIPDSIFSPTRTLSYGSYDIAVGDRLAMQVPHKQYGMVATLILLVLILNIIAICIRSRMSAKLKGQN